MKPSRQGWSKRDRSRMRTIQSLRDAVVEGSVIQIGHVHLDDSSPTAVHTPSGIGLKDHSRARGKLISEVQRTWVHGVLQKSLPTSGIINLELIPERGAVDHRWEGLVEDDLNSNAAGQSVLTLEAAYVAAGKRLLILGEAGSGKTTKLLQLAEYLLEIVRQNPDPTEPIPVVFHLSSWRADYDNLESWMADELNKRYGVATKFAEWWATADLLVPLLDGLDEVHATQRTSCIKAINSFLDKHGQAGVTICSRSTEYRGAHRKVRLNSAIRVRKLNVREVKEYLERAGKQLSGLLAAINGDKKLQKLIQSPLMLSIAISVYSGKTAQEVELRTASTRHRNDLFATYLSMMLTRPTSLRNRSKRKQYDPTESLHWLTWLASTMKTQGHSVFYIDWMQTEWLPEKRDQIRVATAASGYVQPRISLIAITFILYMSHSVWPSYLSDVANSITASILLIASPVLVHFWVRRLDAGGMYIRPLQSLGWDWKPVRDNLRTVVRNALRDGLLAFSLAMATMLAEKSWPKAILMFTIVGTQIMAIGAVTKALDLGLIEKLDVRPIEPGAALRSTDRIAFRVGLAVALAAAELSYLYFALTIGWRQAILPAFMTAYAAYFIGIMMHGGTVLARHKCLRRLIARRGYFPRDCEGFLEFSASRVIMRRVGGGYVFIHSYMQDYLAALWGDEDAQVSILNSGSL